MMQCNCTDDDGMVVGHVRWYDPDGTRLLINTHLGYINGTPYIRRAPDNANILIITHGTSISSNPRPAQASIMGAYS